MNTLSSPLILDHHRCDDLFVMAENSVVSAVWTDADTHFDCLRSSLLRHFQAEEQILFPAFETATGMQGGPTSVMRHEHEQMRQLLNSLAEALASRDGQAYLGRAETLLMLMRQHNIKEENILYPMANQALQAEEKALTERLVTTLNQ